MTLSSRTESGPPHLRVARQDRIGMRVVHIRGDLDTFTAPALRDGLCCALDDAPRVLAVDVSGLDFLGVAGLNTLAEMRDLARQTGRLMVLTGTPQPIVARLLGLVGWALAAAPEAPRVARLRSMS